MATITQVLAVEEAQFLATNFPQLLASQGTNFPVSGLAYDAATDEAAFFKFRAVSYGSGNITLTIIWYAATATSGACVWESQLACYTPDTDSTSILTKAFTTLNFVSDTQLGTTAPRLQTCAITITNLDSIAANDECWLRLARDANGTSATDDMTGDAVLVQAILSYSDT